MRKNIITMGSKVVTGEAGKVLAAGDLEIRNADVEKLRGAGDIIAENSYLDDVKVAGDMDITKCRFGKLHIAGEVTCKDICYADQAVIIGTLDAEQIDCRILRNSNQKNLLIYKDDARQETTIRFNKNWTININNLKNKDKEVNMDFGGSGTAYGKNFRSVMNSNGGSIYKGNIKAETFENLCDFTLDFTYRFQNILSADCLHSPKIIECENFYSFGNLDVEGVNAENIYIRPYTINNLKQVMGSHITISDRFQSEEELNAIPKTADRDYYTKTAIKPSGQMQIDYLEGDNITLEYVTCEKVSGESVYIGDGCVIDLVEYKKEIDISPKAVVKETVQL